MLGLHGTMLGQCWALKTSYIRYTCMFLCMLEPCGAAEIDGVLHKKTMYTWPSLHFFNHLLKCKLDCFRCWNWWCFAQKTMYTWPSLHFSFSFLWNFEPWKWLTEFEIILWKPKKRKAITTFRDTLRNQKTFENIFQNLSKTTMKHNETEWTYASKHWEKNEKRRKEISKTHLRQQWNTMKQSEHMPPSIGKRMRREEKTFQKLI